ncbi:MAG: hypothetical protein ACRDPD_00645, partial [Streptosporangiaceae bacterium]
MVRSGRGSDGGQGQDFADFLRRELHAAADQVEPGSDGLERIRDKIRSRPAHASQPRWILSVWLGVSGAGAGLIRRLGFRAPQRQATHRQATHRQAPERRAPQRPRDWREAMLRPAFAVGAAVFAVGVVLSVVPAARQGMINVGDAIGSAFNSSSSANSTPPATEGQSTSLLTPSASGGVPSSAAVIVPPSQSACPSPSAHSSATPAKSDSPSGTTATTTAPATSSSGSTSSGSTT